MIINTIWLATVWSLLTCSCCMMFRAFDALWKKIGFAAVCVFVGGVALCAVVEVSAMYTDNPYRDFEAYEEDVAAWLRKRPTCEWCGEHIQEETYFEPEPGLILCEDCWNVYVRVNVEKTIE